MFTNPGSSAVVFAWDRLMTQALIPERSRTLVAREPQDAVTALKTEWELLKSQWK